MAGESMGQRTGARERGMTMVIALVVVAVLLFVAVVLLSNAFGSVASENSIRAKIAAFDAAEAGINKVVEVLDQQHGLSTACPKDTLANLADGGAYAWCIEYNAILMGGGKVRDHATGQSEIVVPANTVYAWSSGSSQDGGRGVLIEALIAPSTGLPLPAGAIDAAGDVYSRGPVSVIDSVALSDPAIRANGNITQIVAPQAIEGDTYAAGEDQISGSSGTNSNAPLMVFPTAEQISAAELNAQNEATSSAAMIPPPQDTATLAGSVFINGDVDLDAGTITFEHARSIFINGNLCLHGAAKVVNDDSTIWVDGVVSTQGARDAYSVAPRSSGMLIALGTDTGRPCGNGSRYAVILDSSSAQKLGFVYAPNGSIDLIGSGMVTGALDAGKDIYLDSSQGGGIHYDPAAVRPVPTYDFKVVSYMEY